MSGKIIRIKKMLAAFGEAFDCWNTARGERRLLKKKEKLFADVQLSVEQNAAIDDLFGKNRVNHDWHRLFTSFTGKFDPTYIPGDVYIYIERALNDLRQKRVLSDKNLQFSLFSGLERAHSPCRCPRRILSCVNDVFVTEDGDFKQKTEAVSYLADVGDVVVKATIDTSSGRDVCVCDFHDGVDVKSAKSVQEIMERVGMHNFIVQEKVRQSATMARIYPKSVNTFRVISYLLDGECHIAPVIMRMGRRGAEVDNVHFGGIFIAVNSDGTLGKTAFTEYQERLDTHPDTGIVFAQESLPYYPKLVETARLLHSCVPLLGIVSWDLCIDDNEKVVLIEANTLAQSMWLPQIAHGCGVFQENTERILGLLR